jgi:hypothetical protein
MCICIVCIYVCICGVYVYVYIDICMYVCGICVCGICVCGICMCVWCMYVCVVCMCMYICVYGVCMCVVCVCICAMYMYVCYVCGICVYGVCMCEVYLCMVCVCVCICGMYVYSICVYDVCVCMCGIYVYVCHVCGICVYGVCMCVVYVCACVCVCVCVCVCSSEDILQEWLPIYHVGSEDGIQTVRLGRNYLNQLSASRFDNIVFPFRRLVDWKVTVDFLTFFFKSKKPEAPSHPHDPFRVSVPSQSLCTLTYNSPLCLFLSFIFYFVLRQSCYTAQVGQVFTVSPVWPQTHTPPAFATWVIRFTGRQSRPDFYRFLTVNDPKGEKLTIRGSMWPRFGGTYCNLDLWKAEEGKLWVQDQPGLNSEICLREKNFENNVSYSISHYLWSELRPSSELYLKYPPFFVLQIKKLTSGDASRPHSNLDICLGSDFSNWESRTN